MGHLYSLHNFKGQSVEGTVLGAPTVTYHWDDHRVPSGEILADGTVVRVAVETSSSVVADDVAVAATVTADEPIAVLDEVSALPEALPLQIVLEDIAAEMSAAKNEVTPDDSPEDAS